MDDEQLLSISDAAKRLNVSANTLRRWTESGRIPYIRMPSGHRRFRAGDIEEARRVVSGPEDETVPFLRGTRTTRSPNDYLPSDREPAPEEEAAFYVRISHDHLATSRRMIADLLKLEAVEGLPEGDRAKVVRDRKAYEKQLPMLEQSAERTEAMYRRIIGRPFTEVDEDQ